MVNQIIIARAQGKTYADIRSEYDTTNREIARVTTGVGVIQEYADLADHYECTKDDAEWARKDAEQALVAVLVMFIISVLSVASAFIF